MIVTITKNVNKVDDCPFFIKDNPIGPGYCRKMSGREECACSGSNVPKHCPIKGGE